MPTWWCPVPDSGVAAAIGYAAEAGIPFRQALIRNHYVGRTFIEPSQAIRDFGVKLKLNPIRHLLEGRRVILVDDSIVRGTTSRKIVRMVRGAGAREVHLRISCPPTVSPCFYGVDTPIPAELIAANHTVRGDPPLRRSRFAGISFPRRPARGGGRRLQPGLLLRLLHRQLSDGAGQHRRTDGGEGPAGLGRWLRSVALSAPRNTFQTSLRAPRHVLKIEGRGRHSNHVTQIHRLRRDEGGRVPLLAKPARA